MYCSVIKRLLCGFLATALIMIAVGATTAVAQNDITAKYVGGIDNKDVSFRPPCLEKSTSTVHRKGKREDIQLCITTNTTIKIGRDPKESKQHLYRNDSNEYYPINLDPYHENIYLLPNSNDALYVEHDAMTHDQRIVVLDNIQSRFVKQGATYTLNTSSRKYPTDEEYIRTLGWALSDNGKYLVYGLYENYEATGEVPEFLIINLETMERRIFGTASGTGHYRTADPVLAVNNTGTQVIDISRSFLKVWHIDTCATVDTIEVQEGYAPCKQDMYSRNEDDAGYEWKLLSPVFVQYAGKNVIRAYIGLNDWPIKTAIFDIEIPESTADSSTISKLTYLALGDSYSSGEGDIERKQNGSTYFLNGTNVGDDDCRISERSYPFLLARVRGYKEGEMESIACSGAKILPDFYTTASNYLGQDRRLEHTPKDTLQEKRDAALAKFTPGHIPQLEFIEKYKPPIVTFTGGGNDVGFTDILLYCASGSMVGIVPINETCRYAVKGSELERILYSTIDTQYTYTNAFVRKVQQASPDTNLILIGYPSFIAGGTNCTLNGGLLNNAEKTMLNNAVRYMNSMLKRVAYDNDIRYVDIEDSLVGGRLCEKKSYITGIHDIGMDRLKKGQTKALFHPDAAGHKKIADSLLTSNVFDGKTISSYGDYSPKGYLKTSQSNNIIAESYTTKQLSRTKIRLDPATVKPNSYVKIKIYSDEISMGETLADSDGSLEYNLDNSKIPPGRHVLLVSGESIDGEPIELYQFFTMAYSEQDADGDGIDDEDDRCVFIEAWYDEVGNNICQNNETTQQYGKRTALKKDLTHNSHYSVGTMTSNDIDYDLGFNPYVYIKNTNKNAVHNSDTSDKSRRHSYLSVIMIFGLLILIGGAYGAYKYKKST